MAEKVKILIGGREKTIERKVADFLVKANKARFVADPKTYQTRMMTADNSIVELDATGAAWDETIHSSTKLKTKDGVWQKRRGRVEKDDVAV